MADQKWNLGDIRPAGRQARPRRRAAADVTPKKHPETTESAPRSIPCRPALSRGGEMRKWLTIGGAVALVVMAGFLTTFLLRGAEITVHPKYRDVTVQATFTAEQEPRVGELGYELLILEEVGEREVVATGSEEVEERARGTITIYNEYGTASQRLVKNTRFESPEGLIFRISESVEVPGRTENSSGAVVPGSIEVEVFADETGDEYNIGPVRFSVPGLEGSDQFDDIYAVSSEAMSGGFEGERLTVADDDLADAVEAIRGELRERVLERLAGERPAGFVLYDEAVRIRFESLPSLEAGEGRATIRERALLEVPIFAHGDFAGYLAENTVAGYEGEEVRLDNPQSLAFSYVTGEADEGTAGITFSLSGGARVVWDYDQNELRDDLQGATKTALPAILSKYPAIERADAVVRPFWKGSFPEDQKDIKIVEILEEA